jgi:hypothetical protein
MDTTEFSEGQFITPQLVIESPTRIGVIIDEATPEKTDYGMSLVCKVSIDTKIKKWRMNRDSVKNMRTLNTDSKFWIGKKVLFLTALIQGKERVIGSPVIE